jgi:Fe-Mn family superoxide dismutase
MADHATAPANTTPLLVLDMYEHAFAIDYGAAAARYIDAYFANIQWDAVSRRLQGIQA